MEEKTNIVTDPEAGSLALRAASARGVHEFIRYVVASLVALVGDAGALYVLVHLGMHYLYAGALAFVLGLIVVYALSVWWVFEKRSTRSAWVEFVVFSLVGVCGLGINEGVLWAGSVYVNLPIMISKLLSVCLVFTWNFSARKYLLFRT